MRPEFEINEIIASMTLEEKASLCSGRDFWTTKPIERLGIRSFMLTDGPHGLKKQPDGPGRAGIHGSVPAVCFPTGSCLAAGWDRGLVYEIGKAIAAEARAENVGVLLGPAVNIKRSPLCGRNFEYLSEDPFLAGELAAAWIRGVQSMGVGTSVKHFAANNQERRRQTVNVAADERTLREIYLPAFETAVRDASPWTVMCAYNRLNGEFCSQNEGLLAGILRREWGFDGVVVTDWGACVDRVSGLAAGQDLEMPGNGGINDEIIVEAVRLGKIPESTLDRVAARLLRLHDRVTGPLPPVRFNPEAHHALARRAAGECMVLLRNDGMLPLEAKGRIAFIGAFAKHPRYQGGGSSHLTALRLDSAYDEALKLVSGKAELRYADGYSPASEDPDFVLIREAVKTASEADTAVVFIGLTDAEESEGFDRAHMRLSAAHTALLEEILKVQPNVAVVLSNGAPVEMPWLPRVRAVLEGYLGGQASGGAAADILFGIVNPSGKLAETFPLRVEDNPSFLNFPGDEKRVEYREGIHVGYRYYDAARVPVLFPFGHGLSYTRFEYMAMSVDENTVREGGTVRVRVKVKNTGKIRGKEIVQIYVRDLEASVTRPEKELKNFMKTDLEPGEEKELVFDLGGRAFSFYDTELPGWRIEPGDFEIAACSSSADIRRSVRIRIEAGPGTTVSVNENTTLETLMRETRYAGLLCRFWKKFESKFGSPEPGSPEERLATALFRESPLRSLVHFGILAPDGIRLIIDVGAGRESDAALDGILKEFRQEQER